jgi:RNA polymerase sigma factor (sigma-70 family)
MTVDPALHLGLVHAIARQMHARMPWTDLGDLIGSGTVGLCEACQTYDPQRGAALSTYATHGIRHHMLRHVRRDRQVRASINTPTQDPGTTSLDAPVFADDGETTMHDTLADPDAPDPEAAAGSLEACRTAIALMQRLPPRSRDLLIARVSGRSLRSLAVEHGCSYEAVRLHQHQAIERLRTRLRQR